MKTQTENHAERQSEAQFNSIHAMVKNLQDARDADDSDAIEEAEQAIREDALDVQVSSGWEQAGQKLTPNEFFILLCTGGPAVRIMGELDEHNEPECAWLEYQDWGTPWTKDSNAHADTLLEYCRLFYFGGE